jgi:hypothetical protein
MEEAAVKLQRSLRHRALRVKNTGRWESEEEGMSANRGGGSADGARPTSLMGAAAGVVNAISRGPSGINSGSFSK